MPRAILEHDIHRALIIWLDGNPDRNGVPRTTPALRPGVVCWHTPNGGERRDGFEGKRLKEMGVRAGVHDLLFLWGGLYGLELKKPGEGARKTQLDMHAKMLAAGMVKSAVADDLLLAKQILIRWNLALPIGVDIQQITL